MWHFVVYFGLRPITIEKIAKCLRRRNSRNLCNWSEWKRVKMKIEWKMIDVRLIISTIVQLFLWLSRVNRRMSFPSNNKQNVVVERVETFLCLQEFNLTLILENLILSVEFIHDWTWLKVKWECNAMHHKRFNWITVVIITMKNYQANNIVSCIYNCLVTRWEHYTAGLNRQFFELIFFLPFHSCSPCKINHDSGKFIAFLHIISLMIFIEFYRFVIERRLILYGLRCRRKP